MKKTYIIITIVVVVLIGILLLTGNKKVENSDQNQNANTVTTSYSDGTETVTATFNQDEDTVSFNQKDTGAVTLPIAISASGARYANSDESIVFWEHQGEATITKDGQNVFVGKNLNSDDDNNAAIIDNPILGSWVWQKTKTGDDKTVTPKSKDAFVLSIQNDGSVNSTTDCNNLMGKYTLKSNTGIDFSDMASTKKYCEGSQEDVYAAELSKVSTYSIDGNTLSLGTDGGVMTFERQ